MSELISKFKTPRSEHTTRNVSCRTHHILPSSPSASVFNKGSQDVSLHI